MRDDDVLSNTLSGTLAKDPNVSDSTSRQVWAQRKKSVHEALVRAFSTLAATILRGTISLVEREGASSFVRSGDPLSLSSNPSGQVKPNNTQHAVCDSSCLRRAAA